MNTTFFLPEGNVSRLRLAFLGLPLECTHEVLYLDCRRGLVLSYKCEIIFILEEFIYKICLAYTATTTYDDKFRSV